jgi:hypothetical protein
MASPRWARLWARRRAAIPLSAKGLRNSPALDAGELRREFAAPPVGLLRRSLDPPGMEPANFFGCSGNEVEPLSLFTVIVADQGVRRNAGCILRRDWHSGRRPSRPPQQPSRRVTRRTNFLDQRLLVGDAAVEALRGEDAELGFGEIKPTAVLGGVVPFETLDQAASLDGRERFVKRGLAVDVEIILDEHDGLGVGKMDVGQVLQDLGIVGRGMAIGNFDVAPSGANNMKRLAVPLRSYS